jgi:hypothetical protein
MQSFLLVTWICIQLASGGATLANVKTFGGAAIDAKGDVEVTYGTNETVLYNRDVSPSCLASPSCAAMM